jgi:hypothetical protein
VSTQTASRARLSSPTQTSETSGRFCGSLRSVDSTIRRRPDEPHHGGTFAAGNGMSDAGRTAGAGTFACKGDLSTPNAHRVKPLMGLG